MDEAEFRTVCGHFATGVSVVTVGDDSSKPHGLTANSFTSVSLSPPLVLVCVEKTISSYPPIEAAEGFLVNILSDAQEELARRFATPDIDKFDGVDFEPGPFGAPRLPGCLAYIAARRHSRYDAGDHTIFIGEATGAELGTGRPLIFYRGMYGLPGEINAP
jgi:3-hydroxy-9,10-secoandrosta-1,3,5(10)-triene-9,17-dione monooxygenase reductase component